LVEDAVTVTNDSAQTRLSELGPLWAGAIDRFDFKPARHRTTVRPRRLQRSNTAMAVDRLINKLDSRPFKTLGGGETTH
jgi:hypothetical protein